MEDRSCYFLLVRLASIYEQCVIWLADCGGMRRLRICPGLRLRVSAFLDMAQDISDLCALLRTEVTIGMDLQPKCRSRVHIPHH